MTARTSPIVLRAVAVALLSGSAGAAGAEDLVLPADGCATCLPQPPHEWDGPAFQPDWTLSLRGSYVQSRGSGRFEAVAAPSVSLRHDFLRGSYSFEGTAEVSRSTVEDVRINSLSIGASGVLEVNPVLRLSGAASFDLATPSASSSGYPSDTATASQEIGGRVSAAAAYDWGRVTTTLRGSVERSVYGPTTLNDGTSIDNSTNDNWQAAGGLRIGYELTPIVTAFVDGEVGLQLYDEVAPGYGVRLDATDYAVQAGLAAKWSEVLEAEASAGMGLRQFNLGAAPDIVSWLANGSVTFRPDETLALRGGLKTTVGAPGPNSSAAARIEYVATGDVAYRVNPWVQLRAKAEASYALFSNSAATETGYEVGAGADYLLTEHINLVGDYSYAVTETSGSVSDEHRVTLGVTLKR